ncbi:single-stranded DNA-binding protein [Streptomyces sp. NPDC006879]|uniref:single-stranded DNA-binding protein n=1 Tax=Streptomyces sp. NPDC006879 TaxID=3364767 RepID=UPI0036816EA7
MNIGHQGGEGMVLVVQSLLTLVGHVATRVDFKEAVTGPVARFRFAVAERRWDRRRNSWLTGPTSFYTVWAHRGLAANVAGSVSIGEPLIVLGRLRIRDEVQSEGKRWISADIDALAVGHDLTRGTSAFRRALKGPAALTEPQGVLTS